MGTKLASQAEIDAAEDLARLCMETGLKGDKAAYLALFAEDGVIEIPFNESGRTEEGFYRVYAGQVALKRYLDEAMSAEATLKMHDMTYATTADARSVYVECRGEVKMITGKDYRNRYVFKFDLRDGKIACLKEYYNPITSGIAFGRKIAGKVVIDAPADEGMLVGGLAKT